MCIWLRIGAKKDSPSPGFSRDRERKIKGVMDPMPYFPTLSFFP